MGKKLSEAEINEAILNGDLDALDGLMDEFEEEDEGQDYEEEELTDNDEAEGTDDEEGDEGKAKEGDDTDKGAEGEEADQKKPDAEEGQDATGSSPEVDNSQLSVSFDEQGNAIVPKELLSVVSKDGKHQIPYEVLESSRNKAKEINSKLADERKLREEVEAKLAKNNRQAELLTKQLGDLGIDPAKLPEDFEATPELLESLDEYGALGEAVKHLIVKQAAVKEAKESVTDHGEQAGSDAGKEQQQSPNPDFVNYYKGNEKFKEIMDNEGSDEFETLDHFFKQVSKSPEFKDKPLNQQLDEAMARTNRVFNWEDHTAKEQADQGSQMSDAEVEAIAKQKLESAQNSATPASPSEAGQQDKATTKPIDRAKNASGQELLDVVSELSPAELEALFDQMD